MRGRKILLIILFFLVFIRLATASCVTPQDDLVITTDTVLCGGTYYINDTNGDGVIKIEGSNLTVWFNGTHLIGNGPSNFGKGVFISGNNVTVYDAWVENYWAGIGIEGNGAKIYNANTSLNFFEILITGNNTEIYNSIGSNSRDSCLHDLDEFYHEGLYVRNYTCLIDPSRPWGVYLTSASDVYIENSTFDGKGIGLYNYKNYTLKNVKVYIKDSPAHGLEFQDCEAINVIDSDFIYQGSSDSTGACLAGTSGINLNINNLRCKWFRGGIDVWDSNGTIDGFDVVSSITDFWVGIGLARSSFNVRNVNIQNAPGGIEVWHSINNVFDNITYTTDNPDFRFFYAYNVTGLTLKNSYSEHTGGVSNNWDIRFERSTDVYIFNNTVKNAEWGIVMCDGNTNFLVEKNRILGAGNKGTYTCGDTNYNITILDNIMTTSFGEIGISFENCNNCYAKFNDVSGFYYGIWTCCGGCEDLLILNNTFHDNSVCIGVGQSNRNISIINNTANNCDYYGILLFGVKHEFFSGVDNVEIYGNKITNALRGIGFMNCTNVVSKNNILENLDVGYRFYSYVENVTSCDNTLININHTHGFLLYEGTDTILKNVMRADSDSCTPYMDLSLSTHSINFGSLKRTESKSVSFTLTVNSNMLDAYVDITKTLPYDVFSITFTKPNFSDLKLECYDSGWNPISCESFGKIGSESYTVSLPTSYFDVFPSLNTILSSSIKLTPKADMVGTYSGSITIRVSGDVYDEETFDVLFNILKPAPLGGGGSGPLPASTTLKLFLEPSKVYMKVYDMNGNLVFEGIVKDKEVLTFKPGVYRFVVSAEGYETYEFEMDLTTSKQISIELRETLQQTFVWESLKPVLFVGLAVLVIVIVVKWLAK